MQLEYKDWLQKFLDWDFQNELKKIEFKNNLAEVFQQLFSKDEI